MRNFTAAAAEKISAERSFQQSIVQLMPERKKETAMLNEEKIRLMTGIAMFEKKMMKESIPANRYFKSDTLKPSDPVFYRVLADRVPVPGAVGPFYRFDDLLNAMAVDDLISLECALYFTMWQDFSHILS